MPHLSTYRKLAIPLTSGGYFVLGSQNENFDRDSREEGFIDLSAGWRAWPDGNGSIGQSPNSLRLIETKNYCWAIDQDNESMSIKKVQSSLCDKRPQRWHVEQYKNAVERGSFCIVNHLGFASFDLLCTKGDKQLSLKLEFISNKIDFDTEYRQMTEDIAAFCEQLLLNATAPTALKFSSEPTEQRKLLLESFLFLRHFLSPEKLQTLSEHIHRNPHSALVSEREWKPLSLVQSSQHLSHPSNMLRDWKSINGSPTPAQGLNVRREESHNTPPNQFVKFALQHFRKVTQEVLQLDTVGETITRQAEELQHAIDSTLARPFFRDIAQLNHLPLNNQTLQKREGYRDFLRGWILVESAAGLDWEGQQECFEGETRDVATLYEYWLFLELHKLLEGIDGMHYLTSNPLQDGDQRFIQETAGAISLHLKSGHNSLSSFLYQPNENSEALRIDLHYEKTFTQSDKASSGQSYSRQFRPDYTLSIFPARFETEKQAAEFGKIAHLHFDAKYRVDSITSLFGKKSDELTEEEQKAALAHEKHEAKTNSYKRADLLKMHTYNDALRKTIGSYVLYPGVGNEPRTEFKKFHEIAPSVGAHIMKPGNADCFKALKTFLIDIFSQQQSQFTQFSYLRDVNHSVVSESPSFLKEAFSPYIAKPSARCVVLWLKKSDQVHLRKLKFAYCHAVENDREKDKAINLDLSIEIGSEFIPCGGSRTENLLGLGWRAKITGAHFISKEKLIAYLDSRDPEKRIARPSRATHYILYEFGEAVDIPTYDLTDAHKSERHHKDSRYMAVTTTWHKVLSSQNSNK